MFEILNIDVLVVLVLPHSTHCFQCHGAHMLKAIHAVVGWSGLINLQNWQALTD